MNPDSVILDNLSKSFEYVKFSNQIDNIDDIVVLKDLAKCYFKLYLKQQEVVAGLPISKS